MHILHDSQLYRSNLWPINDLKVGYPSEKFVDDQIYLAAKFWKYPNAKIEERSLLVNMTGADQGRMIMQSLALDTVLESAIYKEIIFGIGDPSYTGKDRHKVHSYLSGEKYYHQLSYTFTVQN
jgi:hypothetical protein